MMIMMLMIMMVVMSLMILYPHASLVRHAVGDEVVMAMVMRGTVMVTGSPLRSDT